MLVRVQKSKLTEYWTRILQETPDEVLAVLYDDEGIKAIFKELKMEVRRKKLIKMSEEDRVVTNVDRTLKDMGGQEVRIVEIRKAYKALPANLATPELKEAHLVNQLFKPK